MNASPSNIANTKFAEAERNAAASREVPPKGREPRGAADGAVISTAGSAGAPTASVDATPGSASFPAPAATASPSPAADEPLFVIDESSDLPLWVQLRNRLAHLIRTGYFKAGEQLPSLRSLSAEARLNYNTVTKAYRDLESSGLIISMRGRGMYVQKSVTVDDSPEAGVDALAEQCVEDYRALGLSFRDIRRRLEDIVQRKSDEASAALDEKRGYYDGKY